MSQIVQRKVIYMTVNNRRYRFTEIIEILDPQTIATVDLTQEADTPDSNTPGSTPQHIPYEPTNTPGNTPQHISYSPTNSPGPNIQDSPPY